MNGLDSSSVCAHAPLFGMSVASSHKCLLGILWYIHVLQNSVDHPVALGDGKKWHM